MPRRVRRVLVPVMAAIAGIAAAAPSFVFSPASLGNAVLDAISTSGSFGISPLTDWGSGDYNAWADEFFGYATPRVNQFRVDMDRTAGTAYEGGLFFRKLKLRVGMDVDVDRNFVGQLDGIMGYINYDIFELRVETAELKGTATWLGVPQGGMPPSTAFDNRYVTVDLRYYLSGDGGVSYIGLGYSSLRLPVQLDCLVWDSHRGSVWWAPVVSFYQPDMAFQVYSAVLGIDSLHDAMVRRGVFGAIQGLGLWMWTQDRAGVGTATIGPDAEKWITTANGLPLWSAEQIPMLVDYNLTVGLQWVGGIGRFRFGAAAGYNVGGQTLTCVTPKGTVEAGYVDASPSVYLFHYGPTFELSVSF